MPDVNGYNTFFIKICIRWHIYEIFFFRQNFSTILSWFVYCVSSKLEKKRTDIMCRAISERVIRHIWFAHLRSINRALANQVRLPYATSASNCVKMNALMRWSRNEGWPAYLLDRYSRAPLCYSAAHVKLTGISVVKGTENVSICMLIPQKNYSLRIEF